MISTLIFLIGFSLVQCSYVFLKDNHISSYKEEYHGSIESSKCQPLTIPACQKLGYNSTRLSTATYSKGFLPNDIIQYLEIFKDVDYSQELLFFACMMYNPICFKNHVTQFLPCKSVCHNVKRKCRRKMKRLSISWPAELNCNDLPDYETDVCIKPKSIIQRDNYVPTVPDNNRIEEPCPTCRKQSELKKFRQYRKSDYVIEGQLISKTKASNGNYKLSFKLYKVLKQGASPMVKYGTFDLWTVSPCLCFELDYEERYYILGRESMANESFHPIFIINDKTIIVKKTHLNRRTLKRWKRKYLPFLKRRKERISRMKNYDQSIRHRVPS